MVESPLSKVTVESPLSKVTGEFSAFSKLYHVHYCFPKNISSRNFKKFLLAGIVALFLLTGIVALQFTD